MLFMMLFLAAFGILVPFSYLGLKMTMQWRKNAPEGYEFPTFYDFRFSLLCSFGFAFAQVFIKKNLKVIFYPWVKKCGTEEERNFRAGKGAYQIFKFILMSGNSIWAWSVLKD